MPTPNCSSTGMGSIPNMWEIATRRDPLAEFEILTSWITFTTKFFNDGTWFGKKNLKWWAQPQKKLKWQSISFWWIRPFHFVDKTHHMGMGLVVLILWPGPWCFKCTFTSLPEKKQKSPTTTWALSVSSLYISLKKKQKKCTWHMG